MESEENTRGGMSESEDDLHAELSGSFEEQVLETKAAPELKELTGQRVAWRHMTVDADAEVPATPIPSPLLTGGAGFVSRRRRPDELDELLEAPTMDRCATDASISAQVSSQLPRFPEMDTPHPAPFTPPPVIRRPTVSKHFRTGHDEEPPSNRHSLDGVPGRRANSLDLAPLQAKRYTISGNMRTPRNSYPTTRINHKGDALEVSKANALDGGACHSGSLLDWAATTS
jgi:hypothetical protein